MAVNLAVDLSAGRFGEEAAAQARRNVEALGFRLEWTAGASDRLSAWIDWQFAPSWWSAEARRGEVLCALDARGDPAGFAAFDVRGMRFPWLRGYAGRTDVGIFGPYGVAREQRGRGLGPQLLGAALSALRAKGYARALIPAVGFEPLVAMYQRHTGAHVVDSFVYDSPRRFRTTILASGGGTNAQNVFDRVLDGRIPLDVKALVANSERAGALPRARDAGVAAHAIVWERSREDRAAYDERVIAAVEATAPELVLLLGWMHRLPPAFIDRFPEILNVHPAFLPFDGEADEVVMPDGKAIPAFRGAHAIRDALAAEVAWLGATVHRVTAEVDRGAVLVRTPLPLDGLATVVAVTQTLRPIEHAAVTAAIRRWCFERNA